MQFKIRCSQIGKIMAGSIGLTDREQTELDKLLNRDKPMTEIMKKRHADLIHKRDNPTLPAGAKTYCKQWLKEKRYGRREVIRSKYLEKGNQCEDVAISMVAQQYGLNISKNESYVENDFLTGTCDVIYGKVIRDTKCSWSLFTFPLFATEIENSDYVAQLQGYMELYDCDEAWLDYVLVDTPLHLIEREAKFRAIQDNCMPEDILEKLVDEMTYIDIDLEERIKSFKITRDKEYMASVKKRVALCQDYINELNGQFKEEF